MQRRNGLPTEAPSQSFSVDCAGSSRRGKDRLTWICRTGLTGVFEFRSCSAPETLPRGKWVDQILLVTGVHCRFEWIDIETRTWKVSHSFILAGKQVTRKAGESVCGVMCNWLDLIASDPSLLPSCWRLWQQPAATMDGIICSWQAQLLSEEFGDGVVHVVDLFSAELTQDHNF